LAELANGGRASLGTETRGAAEAVQVSAAGFDDHRNRNRSRLRQLPIEANVFRDARDPVALNHILATPSSILSPTMGPSIGPGEWLSRLVDDLNANHCATRQTSLTFIR